ncbi:hypothetical protein LR48_Vigan08g054900 [Vigna angularis]|uniref:Serine-threonine/tyrosine-protein kinase catalytic domain-containing protein n=1 Tax=Phaseolus angularis TaxID=3914 RepID=A0A0L9V453_PHAAN|nr:hypothetical protein LR48_Vigan08g054900 [Vigna angularis]
MGPFKVYPTIRRWTLSNIGQIFDGEVYVARADLCYGYNNTDGGCQRWQDIPKCKNPGDVFQKHTGSVSFKNLSAEENISYVHSDCEASCWSNCACSGFMELYSNGTGCMFFHMISAENYTSDSTGYDFYLLANTLSLHKEKKSQRMVTKMADLATCCRSSTMEDFEDDLKKGHGLTVFNYTSVMEATNGFSSENKLGQGGFGPVYRGILPRLNYLLNYMMEGAFSTKSDVYSFGVLLLEIVSGRRSLGCYDVDRPLNLIGHTWELWKEGACSELVDPSIKESIDPDEVQRCIHIGLLCVEHYADDRPSMSDIVSMLTNKSAIASLPQTLAFYVGRKILHDNLSSKGSYTDSAVEITASTIDMTDS